MYKKSTIDIVLFILTLSRSNGFQYLKWKSQNVRILVRLKLEMFMEVLNCPLSKFLINLLKKKFIGDFSQK